MSKEKQIGIEFGIGSIELISLAISELATQINNEIAINYDIKIALEPSPSLSSIFVKIYIDFTDEKREDIFGTIAVRNQFYLSNFKEIVIFNNQKDPKEFDAPKEFMVHLADISVHQTRGFIRGIMKGTILHHATLPGIDVQELRSQLPMGPSSSD